MILDGKTIKKEIINELKDEVNKLSVKPHFVVIQVGDNEASNVYIKQKVKMADDIGYICDHIKFSNDVSMDELLSKIDILNRDTSIHGIMVQMPLPNTLNESVIQNAIVPEKDIDGLCDMNAGMLFHGKDALYSCTPYGVMELLKRYNISVCGKNVVIVGRSSLVGKPMTMMLINEGATVTVCHSKTESLEKYTKKADILISAVGKANLITSNMVKKNSIIVDVGITRTENGLCGDVDYNNVLPKVKYITPVPGGVGQMTVAMLAMNILKAYKIQKNVK